MVDTNKSIDGKVLTMPKAKPTQVIVHRIELQEKEREFLETLQTTQSIKNLGFAAAGASVPFLGFMSYKAWKEWKGQDEGTVFEFFSKEGRIKLNERQKEKGFFGGLREVIFDPFGINPFW